MTKLVKLKIAVDSIEKERLFRGKKHTYLDATVFLDDQEDQYGNHGMITQDVSKEEREQGVKGPILGNAKIVWSGESKGGKHQNIVSDREEEPREMPDGDEIPF